MTPHTHEDPTSCILSILKGTRNGIFYAGRIRLVHSLVMSILFKRNITLASRLKIIFSLTRQHVKYVAITSFLQKSLPCIFNRSLENIRALIIGLITGYLACDNNSNVHQQIYLYGISRVFLAFASIVKQKIKLSDNVNLYPIFAGLVWGCVMWIFEQDHTCLQSSLDSSMQYIYKESDKPGEFLQKILGAL